MSKQHYRTILILLTIACGVGAVVTAIFVMLTAPMAFDAPEGKHQLGAWVVFFIILSLPLWFIVCAGAGWLLYRHDWLRTSLLVAAAPLAAATAGWLLILVLILVLSAEPLI